MQGRQLYSPCISWATSLVIIDKATSVFRLFITENISKAPPTFLSISKNCLFKILACFITFIFISSVHFFSLGLTHIWCLLCHFITLFESSSLLFKQMEWSLPYLYRALLYVVSKNRLLRVCHVTRRWTLCSCDKLMLMFPWIWWWHPSPRRQLSKDFILFFWPRACLSVCVFEMRVYELPLPLYTLWCTCLTVITLPVPVLSSS